MSRDPSRSELPESALSVIWPHNLAPTEQLPRRTRHLRRLRDNA